jgi:hypothetical protein
MLVAIPLLARLKYKTKQVQILSASSSLFPLLDKLPSVIVTAPRHREFSVYVVGGYGKKLC